MPTWQYPHRKIFISHIVGDKDIAANAVSVRLRSDEDLGAMPVSEFEAMVNRVVTEKSLGLK